MNVTHNRRDRLRIPWGGLPGTDHGAYMGCRETLLSKLRQGVTLVVDRYAFSGAVFTAAKGLPGLDLEWAKVSRPPRPLSSAGKIEDKGYSDVFPLPCFSYLLIA